MFEVWRPGQNAAHLFQERAILGRFRRCLVSLDALPVWLIVSATKSKSETAVEVAEPLVYPSEESENILTHNLYHGIGVLFIDAV